MKVKILLEQGETIADADQALFKALSHHASGDAHDGEAFEDPAMVHLSQRLEEMHANMYVAMTREIEAVLDEEYSHGGE
jgi:hypothetical protein